MAENRKLTDELSGRFWDSMKKRIGKESHLQPVLYHYTSLTSLMGMIENNNLWMSKGTFLNDSNELIYIAGIIQNIIGKMEGLIAEKYGEQEGVEQLQHLFLQQLKHTLVWFQDEVNLDDFEVYVLSLTENKDSLALWYNYSKGEGYNIGFSSTEMLNHITNFSDKVKNEYSLVYGQVIYDRKEQENLLMDFFMETVDYLLQSKVNLQSEEVSKELYNHLFFTITVCSIFFKNAAFKSEEEYRIALPRKKASDSNNREVTVHFRAQTGIIIPFITIGFDYRLPVRHVTIGPKNNIDVAKAGIEHYLKSRGYNTEEISISKSIAEIRY